MYGESAIACFNVENLLDPILSYVMEIITFFISVFVLFTSLCYLFCKITPISPRKQPEGYQLPPGNQGWPFIGETLEYLSTAKNGVPEKFIEDRRNKYSDDVSSPSSCKVFMTSLAGEPMAILCTAAGNKFLFSNENKLVKTWWPPIFQKLFSEPKSEFSKVTINNRRAILHFIKPDAIRKHIGIMDQVTKDHFGQHWSLHDQKQVIKFHCLVKQFTLSLSCRLFLNLEDPKVIAQLHGYIRIINDGITSFPLDFPGTRFYRAVRASRKMKKEIQRMVKQRKIDLMNTNKSECEQLENMHQDLMSSFLLETSSDGDKLSEEEISFHLCGVLLAGFDPIINTLCSTVIVLSQLPEVYNVVYKEQMEIAESKNRGELLNWEDVQKMKYTWNVICEVLRLHPPASGTFREAMSDFVYEGFLIPKGMKLHWNVHATHKSSEYFPDPHKFDPSRFEGMALLLTRMFLLVFLHNLITRFKWEMVHPEEKMIVDPVPFPTKGLHLHIFPRI